MGGATIMNRIIRVDHTRYKKKDNGDADGHDPSERAPRAGIIENDKLSVERTVAYGYREIERPLLKEELELAALIRDHDDDDPMKLFLIKEKKEQIAAGLATLRDSKASDPERKIKGHHRHQHRGHNSHRSGDIDGHEDDKRHFRRHEAVRRRHRSRSRN